MSYPPQGLDKADINAALAILQNHQASDCHVFPEETNEACEFEAGALADTFGNWVEITGDATTLSSKFAANSGYLRRIQLQDFSEKGSVYIIEIAYGAAKTILARLRMLAETEGQRIDTQSTLIPAGSTIYYRMKCEVGAATLEAGFSYYYV